MSEVKMLNTSQVAAIEHGSGPLLIIAGAGTGKTTVVTERVKHLINNGLAQPDELLCLTFTEKAAAEMEERIDTAMPYGFAQMWITTFHSFCDRILRDEALNIGLDPAYKLLSDTDSLTLLKRHLFELGLKYYAPLGNPYKFLGALLQHMSRLKDEDVSPEAYATFVDSVTDMDEQARLRELSHIYSFYEQVKAKTSVMDFGDLISNTLNLFRTRPHILTHYQSKFKYMLVDEYQDTNFAQNQLVNLLAGSTQNLTVVADDDQAIYRWRGAAVSNVIQFRQTYPDAKLIVLTENYRSTQEILDRSYTLIQHNNPDRLEVKEGIDKKLTSTRKVRGDAVEFLHFDRADSESLGVAKKIKEILDKSPALSPKDIAILVRANAHAEPFLRSLAAVGIQHQFLGPSKLYQQAEVRDLLAYLYVLDNFSDNPSMYRLLSMEFFALPARDIAAITNFAKRANCDVFEACEIVSGLRSVPNGVLAPRLEPATTTQIQHLMELLRLQLSRKTTFTAGELLYQFMADTGMLQAIVEFKSPFDEIKSQNIIKLFDKIKSYELIHPEAYIPQVVEWLNLASEIGESPLAGEIDLSGTDAVNVLTLHSSKGLEFPVVFLVNLVSQRFPTTARKELIPIPDQLIKEQLPLGDFHIQEERRLMYVGITRAKDKLFLTAADYYGDGKRAKKLSPFIAETLGPSFMHTKQPVSSQLSLLEFAPSQKKPSAGSMPEIKVDYLSYSQIQTFIDCPLHYKLKYILRLPTPPSAASSFGNTIHATLKEFYARKGQQDIVEIFSSCWTPDGYRDKKHESEYRQKGIRYLTEFVASQFDASHLPLKLEEPFTVPLTSSDGRFIKIGGKMDRVDMVSDGCLEIIDYKTSENPMDQKEADSSLQLSFYALAATTLRCAPFGVPPDKIKMTLFYFDEQRKVTTTRTQQQLQAAKEEIFSYADQIMHSDFVCSGSILCRQCDFKLLCGTSES